MFKFSAVRLIIFALVLLGGLGSSQASTISFSYTDAFSNSASLTLTVTPAGTDVYHVTNVAGTWDGFAVTVGPVDNSVFGSRSDLFYTDPLVLTAPTIDTGFVFKTSVSTVDFYAFNVGSNGSGYGTAYYNPDYHTGEAFIRSITITPEPTTLCFCASALLLLVGWRKYAVRRG